MCAAAVWFFISCMVVKVINYVARVRVRGTVPGTRYAIFEKTRVRVRMGTLYI